MGLDSVELVLATEEAFGISIADSEAEHCRTPRDLVALLFSKLTTTDRAICQSQRAFYLLRRECMRSCGHSRSAISLQTSARELIPSEKWTIVRDALQARSWPELTAPGLVVAVRVSLPFIMFFGTYGVLHLRFAELILFNLIVSGIVAGISHRVVKSITRPCNRLVPAKMKIKDLLYFVVTSEEIAWTRGQVSERVKQLVIEQLGLSEDDYFEDADFIRDLGMD